MDIGDRRAFYEDDVLGKKNTSQLLWIVHLCLYVVKIVGRDVRLVEGVALGSNHHDQLWILENIKKRYLVV